LVYFFDTQESIDFLSVCLSLVSLSVLFSSLLMTALRRRRRSRRSYVLIMSLFSLSREVIFRARALEEKKRISIDYRRLCGGLLPQEEEERRRKRRRFAFWVRVCRIKILLFDKKNDDDVSG